MPADYLNCDPNALVVAARCFIEPCCSEAEREAIDILLRVQELVADGYTDLSDPTLLQQTFSGYNRLSKNERRAMALYLDLQNAIAEGATFPDGTDISGLKKAARCYLCIPKERRRDILLGLKCLLNSRDEPE